MTPKIRKLIFDLKSRYLKPKLFRVHMANENALKSNNIEDINFNKRKALVIHAKENSLFYSKKYASLNLNPFQMLTEEDFIRLPVVTRADLTSSFSEIISKTVSKWDYSKATTSGSTGATISVLHDKRYPIAPIQWRVLQWWGIKPYDHTAFIYRFKRRPSHNLWNSILWWPTKRIFLAGSVMDPHKIRKFVCNYNILKPTLLQGYVDVVYEFALFLKDKNIKIHSPKAVWVTSAPLTVQQRQTMEEVFKAPVYDQYGSTEVMWVSSECKEQNGLHVMTDVRHIEIVDDNNQPVPKNSWGKILITDLHNYAFPLIRYEIGDYGRFLDRKCPCGSPLPLMDSVRGRQSDVIKTPSGIEVYGDYLHSLFDEFPDTIREFQIVQAKDYVIKLFYVPVPDKNIDSVIKSVMQKLDIELNSEITIKSFKVDKVEQINGKTPFIISHIL